MDTAHDYRELRCPRLGGPVTFLYCRQCGDKGMPCWKVFDCWWEYFDIVTFLENQLPHDQLREIAAFRPKPKVSSLIELIEEAKKHMGERTSPDQKTDDGKQEPGK